MAVRDVVQAAAGVGGGDKLYVEDVFSTYLYTGNGSTQTITNGIDLDGEGGMVWTKGRSTARNNNIVDTARGGDKMLYTNTTGAEFSLSSIGYSSYLLNSNGFTTSGAPVDSENNQTFASWTFCKAPKFFDVVTWTGNGSNPRNIAHNLGSVPGFIVVKNTGGTSNWYVLHRGDGTWVNGLCLNDTRTGSSGVGSGFGTPTSTDFVITNGDTNGSGQTYVAYLFAHDAGGFGDSGEENVISCGSYTGNGSTTGPVINLGWEPQWLLVKKSSGAENWVLIDNMRGINTSVTYSLFPNLSDAETSSANTDYLTQLLPTGFQINNINNEMNTNGGTYIYIAIRRGPMKTPESGTEVYHSLTRTGTASNTTITNPGFPVDWVFSRGSPSRDGAVWDRLRGALKVIYTSSTSAETTGANSLTGFDLQNGVRVGVDNSIYQINDSTQTYINYQLRRAPGVFDIVAYTGSVSSQNISHNLSAQPELILIKKRSSGSDNWVVQVKNLGARKYLSLDSSEGATDLPLWNGTDFFTNTLPTSSVFTVGGGTAGGGYDSVGSDGLNYIAYLFSSLDGVSKVGTYSGTGGNVNVDCGFSSGARFILIKRTDSGSTGDWYVWDSARGIVSGNDPYLLLNSTATENTSTDYIDPLASGFTVTSSAPAALNASGGNYIFLAIA